MAKPVVGLLGGIGSGKSQVADALARRGGGRVIAADDLAHEALRQPEIRDRVVARWGAHLLDEGGAVRRRSLADIVFGDPAELRALEALVHPWIKRRIREEVDRAQADPAVRLVVLDAAIMLEAGWGEACDRLVFVEAPRELRLSRLARKRGWSEAEVAAREAAQMPLTEKAVRADHTLDNSGSLGQVNRQVDDLLRQWGLTPVP